MASSREIERTAAAWLASRDADHWSELDQVRLDAWLDAATAHRVAFIRLDVAWRHSGRLKALGAGLHTDGVPADHSWASRRSGRVGAPTHATRHTPPRSHSHRHATSQQRTPPRTLVRALAIATLIVLVLTLALGWRHYTAVEQASYRTAVGEVQEVPLVDGSTATLSSDSQILVTVSRAERHIDLQRGEAFFAVAKDPRRPFVVSANGRRAIAVGTRFAVRREDDAVRVVVIQGVVRLEPQSRPGGSRQPTTLLPAGSVALAGDTGVVVRSESVLQAREYLSWRNGFLSFHDTPLANAVAEFNRYNTRKIVIGDATIGTMRVGGNFRWANTDAFVRLLQQGFPILAEDQHGDVVLYHR